MSAFLTVYKKLFNLGNFSRVLLIIPKPLILWLSIQLDSDAGLAIAQIYLIGILFLSLLGTNAHRPFYKIYFGISDPIETKKYLAKTYFNYIQKITLQFVFIIITAILVAFVFFWNSFEIVILGIIFGIAEKLYDEYNRFVQFKNTNKLLFNIALSKLVPALLAGFLSYVVSVDIKYSFTALLFFTSVFINRSTIYFAASYLIKSIRKSFSETLKLSLKKISEDISQVSCIFIGISLLNIEKWLLQYFSVKDLPMYMLYFQFASILIVIQTIILIAPVRAKLINKNPWEIKIIKIGSPIISLISLLVGIALYFYDILEGRSSIGYFSFFFAAIIILENAYSECLYWRTTARVRLSLDLVIIFMAILYFVVLKMFWPLSNLIILTFVGLCCLMILRFLVIVYLLNKIKLHVS
jgi:hypothetical protein